MLREQHQAPQVRRETSHTIVIVHSFTHMRGPIGDDGKQTTRAIIKKHDISRKSRSKSTCVESNHDATERKEKVSTQARPAVRSFLVNINNDIAERRGRTSSRMRPFEQSRCFDGCRFLYPVEYVLTCVMSPIAEAA